jgi:hypothetical protein
MLTMLIYDCQCTPSEVREAAILACINYESIHIKNHYIVDPEIEKAFTTLRNYSREGEEK